MVYFSGKRRVPCALFGRHMPAVNIQTCFQHMVLEQPMSGRRGSPHMHGKMGNKPAVVSKHQRVGVLCPRSFGM